MKLTVVINNYNYDRYLKQAIDSALAQSYQDVEVIVVDDGSTDGSRDIIRQYGSAVIPIFQANGGQAAALNSGFSSATGDVVIFLDSDDLLLPDIGAAVIREFRSRPTVGKVQFRLDVIDARGNRTGARLPPARISLPEGDIRPLIRRCRSYAHPPTSGNAFRVSAIEPLMPIPESVYRKGAAAYLVYNVVILSHIWSLDQTGGLYRIHGDNVTKTNPFLDGEKLRGHVEEDICLRRKQMELFAKESLSSVSEVGWGDLTHVKSRTFLKKFYPESYKYNDTLAWLCVKGVVAASLYPYIRFRDRILWSAWFVALPFLPRGWAKRLGIQLVSDEQRPAILQQLLGRRDRSVS